MQPRKPTAKRPITGFTTGYSSSTAMVRLPSVRASTPGLRVRAGGAESSRWTRAPAKLSFCPPSSVYTGLTRVSPEAVLPEESLTGPWTAVLGLCLPGAKCGSSTLVGPLSPLPPFEARSRRLAQSPDPKSLGLRGAREILSVKAPGEQRGFHRGKGEEPGGGSAPFPAAVLGGLACQGARARPEALVCILGKGRGSCLCCSGTVGIPWALEPHCLFVCFRADPLSLNSPSFPYSLPRSPRDKDGTGFLRAPHRLHDKTSKFLHFAPQGYSREAKCRGV